MTTVQPTKTSKALKYMFSREEILDKAVESAQATQKKAILRSGGQLTERESALASRFETVGGSEPSHGLLEIAGLDYVNCGSWATSPAHPSAPDRRYRISDHPRPSLRPGTCGPGRPARRFL